MSDKNQGHSAYKPLMPWESPVRTETPVRQTTSVPLTRGGWKKKLLSIYNGGIQRRLMIWGLSLFGIALLIGVAAGYFYMVQQIRHDAAALQSELASLTGEQVRSFVRRKIDRFSDNANALSLYQLASKEQQLLLGLLVKRSEEHTHASIIDSQGMEVLKVSDRKVYFPSD